MGCQKTLRTNRKGRGASARPCPCPLQHRRLALVGEVRSRRRARHSQETRFHTHMKPVLFLPFGPHGGAGRLQGWAPTEGERCLLLSLCSSPLCCPLWTARDDETTFGIVVEVGRRAAELEELAARTRVLVALVAAVARRTRFLWVASLHRDGAGSRSAVAAVCRTHRRHRRRGRAALALARRGCWRRRRPRARPMRGRGRPDVGARAVIGGHLYVGLVHRARFEQSRRAARCRRAREGLPRSWSRRASRSCAERARCSRAGWCVRRS